MDSALPRSTRVVIIVQLSLVFWTLISASVQPFMADYWAQKTTDNLYRLVMGDQELLKHVQGNLPEWRDRLGRNRARFQALPPAQRVDLEADFAKRQGRKGKTFSDASRIVGQSLGWGISPYVQAWMLFSFITCLFLLLRIEGAQQATWLLLLLTLFYAFHNQQHGSEGQKAPDLHLIPSEEAIVDQALQGSASEQRQQLQQAWEAHLIRHWAGEEPKEEDTAAYALQVEKGEFAFLLARLQSWRNYKSPGLKTLLRERHSLFALLIMLLWHSFFAYFVNRKHALGFSQSQDDRWS